MIKQCNFIIVAEIIEKMCIIDKFNSQLVITKYDVITFPLSVSAGCLNWLYAKKYQMKNLEIGFIN